MLDQNLDDTLEAEAVEPEAEDVDPVAAESDEPDSGDEEGKAEPEGEELVISFDGEDEQEAEPEPEADNSTLRQMRKRIRELEKQAKEREEKQTEKALGEKPTLAVCDYDEDKYDAALLEWNSRKAEADAVKARVEERNKRDAEEWQSKFQGYTARKSAIPDIEDAEDVVRESLTPVAQSIIVDVAKSPEYIIAALGRSPKKLAELQQFDTTTTRGAILFTAKLKDLEASMKVSGVKPKPAPEKRMPPPAAPSSGAMDAKLEKLRERAEETGDYTAYFEAKRKAK